MEFQLLPITEMKKQIVYKHLYLRRRGIYLHNYILIIFLLNATFSDLTHLRKTSSFRKLSSNEFRTTAFSKSDINQGTKNIHL